MNANMIFSVERYFVSRTSGTRRLSHGAIRINPVLFRLVKRPNHCPRDLTPEIFGVLAISNAFQTVPGFLEVSLQDMTILLNIIRDLRAV